MIMAKTSKAVQFAFRGAVFFRAVLSAFASPLFQASAVVDAGPMEVVDIDATEVRTRWAMDARWKSPVERLSE